MTEPNPLLAHPALGRLATALADRSSVLAEVDGDPKRAAVAIVLRVGAGDALELLLIKRSDREGDPWSGQIALPGGRFDHGDATLQDTATRETMEETGIDIAEQGVVLGMLDELRPRTSTLPPIIVSPFVAVVPAEVAFNTNEEVAEAFWVPLASFSDPDVAMESTVHVRGADWRVPSYRLGGHVVWGMTERILKQLFELTA